jgi:hypothetical protein
MWDVERGRDGLACARILFDCGDASLPDVSCEFRLEVIGWRLQPAALVAASRPGLLFRRIFNTFNI